MNQTPRQQLEEKLIGFAAVVKGWQKESPQLYDEVLNEILTIFKSLPAMQEVKNFKHDPQTGSPLGEAAYMTIAQNELRRQILAELEEK